MDQDDMPKPRLTPSEAVGLVAVFIVSGFSVITTIGFALGYFFRGRS